MILLITLPAAGISACPGASLFYYFQRRFSPIPALITAKAPAEYEYWNPHHLPILNLKRDLIHGPEQLGRLPVSFSFELFSLIQISIIFG